MGYGLATALVAASFAGFTVTAIGPAGGIRFWPQAGPGFVVYLAMLPCTRASRCFCSGARRARRRRRAPASCAGSHRGAGRLRGHGGERAAVVRPAGSPVRRRPDLPVPGHGRPRGVPLPAAARDVRLRARGRVHGHERHLFHRVSAGVRGVPGLAGDHARPGGPGERLPGRHGGQPVLLLDRAPPEGRRRPHPDADVPAQARRPAQPPEEPGGADLHARGRAGHHGHDGARDRRRDGIPASGHLHARRVRRRLRAAGAGGLGARRLHAHGAAGGQPARARARAAAGAGDLRRIGDRAVPGVPGGHRGDAPDDAVRGRVPDPDRGLSCWACSS